MLRVPLRLLAAILLGPAVFAQNATVFLADGTTPLPATTTPTPTTRPVLFVHGHQVLPGFLSESEFHFAGTWIDAPAGQSSFKAALDLAGNQWLDLEAYYIHFADRKRSIPEDALEIADAVKRILQRHDPGYDPNDPASTTEVRVAIVAFSKGTISTRLYLKSLADGNLFNPVSEFIAISPPNHGLSLTVLDGQNFAGRELGNGVRSDCSTYLVGHKPTTFFADLNGHPITDTMTSADQVHPLEAPGSRENGAPVSDGTLYVCLFADEARDRVGGSAVSSDCQGRDVAANLAPHAVNLEVSAIHGDPGASAPLMPWTVHRNTPHTAEVICLALHSIQHHRAPPDDLACTMAGDHPLIAPRAAVSLVLDVSGSMLHPLSDPKIAELQDAVRIFLEMWTEVGGPGDRISATFFGSSVANFQPANPLLELSQANADLVADHVDDQAPLATNMTAMGGGLQRAIEILESPPAAGIPERHIVLFTDGMQNRNPMVLPNGSGQLEIADEAGVPSSGVLPTGKILDTALGIEVHAIGVGATPAFEGLLNTISLDTGTEAHITSTTQQLRDHFTNVLIHALRGNSPQLVDYRYGALPGEGATEAFPIGSAADKIVLTVSWQRGRKLDFRVEKDGVDVTSMGRVRQGEFYRIFAIDDPAASNLSAAGDWVLRIAGPPGASYEASAIVDGPKLEYDFSVTRAAAAGTPLELSLNLTLDGRPVADARSVRATVHKPRESLGSLLSTESAPDEPPGFAFEGSAGGRKLQLLTQDARFRERLMRTSKGVTLASQGDGAYAGTFTDTAVAGAYGIVFTLDVGRPEIGPCFRTDQRTAVVGIGRITRASAGLALQREADRTAVILRPRDEHGNYLGPDQAAQLRVTLSPGRAGEPVDHVDGSYTVPLEYPEGEDPAVTVSVMGTRVFEDRLSALEDAGGIDLLVAVMTVLLVLLLARLVLRRRA